MTSQGWKAASLAQTAHHEAGHAVTVVLRGGELVKLFFVDREFTDSTATRNGVTRSRGTPYDQQAFTTFAGPWADATWQIENDPEQSDEDFDEVFYNTWDWGMGDEDSDAAMYEARWDYLAEATGFPMQDRQWEDAWMEELEKLWPAICEVAGLMLEHDSVSHQMVREALLRHLDEGDPRRARIR